MGGGISGGGHIQWNKLVVLLISKYKPFLVSPPQKLQTMTQRAYKLEFTHQELTTILQNMLKIPKTHKPLHPSPERTRYAALFEYLVTAMGSLLKQKHLPAKDLAQQQQQLITGSLSQLIELTRRQCLQKSMVLQMIQQYLISTLNAYWQVFENTSKEISYEYEHNAVKIEKEYISEIKRLQVENEELKRDKQHRWRNMFMLIKDNRVHRKKNKKLMKSINHELEKGRMMTEQMIIQQFQNEKIKARLDYLQEQTFNLQDYLEMTIKLVYLEKKVKKYPQRCKKMLKNDLINIEISQIKNLQDKINFIIKAVEETGEIIDEIYDEDVVFSNFHYNISTQTEPNTEDRGVNTPIVRFASTETETYNREHSCLTHCDTLELKIRGLKYDKKDVNRDSKNIMFMNQTVTRFNQQRREDYARFGRIEKRIDILQHFSICEAIKITIFQARIAYISTYNTQIFNGVEVNKHLDQKDLQQAKCCLSKGIEIEVQTDPPVLQETYSSNFNGISRNVNRKQSKMNVSGSVMQENRRLMALKMENFQMCREIVFCYDPNRHNRARQQIKMKITHNNIQKQTVISKQVESQKSMQTQRQNHQFDKTIMKDSSIASKVTIKKTKNQWKKTKIYQDQEKFEELKRYHNTFVQTENTKNLSIKNVEDYPKDNQQYEHSKNTTIKAIESTNTDLSELISPIVNKTPKKQSKAKQINHSMKSINTSKIETLKESRNKSSIMPVQQFKGVQSYRLSKLKDPTHKRTVTQTSEMLQPRHQSKLTKISQFFKSKPLHRISQDIREIQHFGEEHRRQVLNRSKQKTLPLPFIVGKEGEFVIKDMDFSKGLEKILKNMDMRRQQILNNQHTMKSYLVSYFKCLYGRQLYQNFLNFLINASEQTNQQLIICFNKLTNSKLPQPYLIDLFRTFIIMLNKCYLISESPTSDRIRVDLLKSMVSLYYEDQEAKKFVIKMNRYNIHSFSGWFIALEDQLRTRVICSQLYHFLSEIMIQSQDSITYSFIEELAYFIPSEQLQFKNLIRSKTLLGKKTAIHRFALFCLRYQWRKMLSLQQTIQQEYLKVLGLFNYQKSITNIESNMTILSEFKNLHKCVKYWLFMREKYGGEVSSHLLMICELVVMEYRMKVDFPISRELRFINLACEGLQKKLFHEELREVLEMQEGRNNSLY